MSSVIKKAANVLEIISKREPCSLKYLTEATKAKKPTLYLMLKSLVEVGFLEKSTTGEYSIGRTFYHLAHARRNHSHLQICARNAARALSAKTHESVTVAVVEDLKYKRLYHENCTLPVMLNDDLIHTFSFYESATGRVLLAGVSPEQLRLIVSKHGYPERGEWAGVYDLRTLETELKKIREEGGTSMRNSERGAFYVAAFVRSAVTDSVFAIGVDIPEFRAEKTYTENIFRELREITRNLMNELGDSSMPVS